MYQIIKRDGKIVDFDITKIANAIKKAFEATDTEYTDDIIDFIALKVSADFLPKIKDGYIAVEDIQDSVEAVLSRGGYEGVAKAYILVYLFLGVKPKPTVCVDIIKQVVLLCLYSDGTGQT